MEYDERLTVPLRWWVQGTMLVATFWLALVVALPPAAAWSATAVLMAAMTTLFVTYGGARVRVHDGRLHAGRAAIDLALLGPARALDAETTRLQVGVQADARAYLVLRPYLKQAVRVDLDDPADPTPYWLISSRHPEELVATVQRAGARLTVGNAHQED